MTTTQTGTRPPRCHVRRLATVYCGQTAVAVTPSGQHVCREHTDPTEDRALESAR